MDPLNDLKYTYKVVVNHAKKFVQWFSRYSHFHAFIFSQIL